jgi:hypothetical protein
MSAICKKMVWWPRQKRQAVPTFLMIVAALNLLLPRDVWAETPQPRSTKQPRPATSSRVYDLEARNGKLRGQVLSPQGQPLPHATVVLFQQNGILAKTRANEQGEFRFDEVSQGVYGIAAANGVCVYHVWDAGNSPTPARSAAMIVAGQNVLRGQTQYASWWQNPWVIIALIASIICVPIAVSSASHGA